MLYLGISNEPGTLITNIAFAKFALILKMHFFMPYMYQRTWGWVEKNFRKFRKCGDMPKKKRSQNISCLRGQKKLRGAFGAAK